MKVKSHMSIYNLFRFQIARVRRHILLKHLIDRTLTDCNCFSQETV